MSSLESFVAGLPKAELHVHQVGSASPRIVAQLAERHPGSGAERPRGAGASSSRFPDFAHFIEIYLSVVDLVATAEDVRLLTYEVAREMAGAADPLRRADGHAVPRAWRPSCPPRRSWRPSRTPGRRPSATSASGCAGSSTSRPTSGSRPRRRRPRSPSTTTCPGLVGFGVGGPEVGFPRSMFADQFDARPGRRAAQRPARGRDDRPGDRSGTRSRTWAPSASGTASAPYRTPSCWPTSPSTGSPSTSARPPTSPQGAVAGPGRAPAARPRRRRRRRQHQHRRPADVRHRPEPRVRVAAELLGLDEAGVARLARAAVDASFVDETYRAGAAGEIDAYVAERGATA